MENKMSNDYLQDLLRQEIDAGRGEQSFWWREDRIPLGSIDKSVAELLDLSGRKAVVTGGAGINLGQACVNRLAGLGADVAVVDLDPTAASTSGRQRWAQPPDAGAIARQAAARWGVKTIAVHGDLTDWDDVQSVLQRCHDELGAIDILVNNAADAAIGDFTAMGREAIDRTARGTLLGPIYCARAALDHMIPRGFGRIINVGSEAANTAIPDLTLYGTMKAGLAGFTRLLAKEVAHHGIQVLGVNAGSMWGPNRALGQDNSGTLYARARTAIQRYQLPEEVANMVGFLASDAASAMAGSMIDMGGGMAL
jgi:3-oxoacyl-[acyl-carrier protein] reductase